VETSLFVSSYDCWSVAGRGTGTVYYDPIGFSYEYCACPNVGAFGAFSLSSSWYWNDDTLTCQQCPTGYICDHEQVEDSTTALIVRNGYYPLCNGSSTEHAATCGNRINRYPPPHVVACFTPSACNPGRAAVFTCAEGHDQDSLMCSRCLLDWYNVAGRCVECPSSPATTISILTVIAIIVLIIGVARWKYESGMCWFRLHCNTLTLLWLRHC
jgi:hypothetical protein